LPSPSPSTLKLSVVVLVCDVDEALFGLGTSSKLESELLNEGGCEFTDAFLSPPNSSDGLPSCSLPREFLYDGRLFDAVLFNVAIRNSRVTSVVVELAVIVGVVELLFVLFEETVAVAAAVFPLAWLLLLLSLLPINSFK
jgi:hypothetical protein